MGVTRFLRKQTSKKSAIFLLEFTENDFSDETNVKTMHISPRTQTFQI